MHPMRVQHLREILNARGINHLVHCTPLDNLESILTHGLVPVETISQSRTIHGVRTDRRRLDGNLTATCCSVQKPNTAHLRRGFRNIGEQAVVIISPDVVLNKICAFYPRNAAARKFRFPSLRYWQRSERFEELFADNEARKDREGVRFPDNWTTNEEAEVHVFGNIETDYIEQVSINHRYHRKSFERRFPDLDVIPFMPGWI